MVVWHLNHKKHGDKPWDVQLATLAAKYEWNTKKWGHFLEQGLGKTPVTLNEFVTEIDQFDVNVVLSPNSFKIDWTLAPQTWGLDIKTGMWPRDPLPTGRGEPQLYAMNYEAARSSAGQELHALMQRRRVKLTIDESSKIANFRSDTSKMVLELCKFTDQVTLLNGTPLTRDVMNMFPQLKALGQLNGWNPFAFRNRFAIMGGFMGKQVVRGEGGIKNAEELHEIQKVCSFRALKKDWRDLPPKLYPPLHLDMTGKQWKHYKEMMEDFYTIVGVEEYDAQLVLTQMDKLRQITSGVLIDGERFTILEEGTKNPKIKAALDVYEGGPGKMIIAYHYKPTGQAIFDAMTKAKLQPVWLRGGMKPEEFFEEKRQFNDNPERRIAVANIGAVHMGHDLVGQEGVDRCTRMFFHDNTFSLLERSQMEDRPHRGEQDQAVNYYTPIMSPIDEAQIVALDEKQRVADIVVNAVRRMRDGQWRH